MGTDVNRCALGEWDVESIFASEPSRPQTLELSTPDGLGSRVSLGAFGFSPGENGLPRQFGLTVPSDTVMGNRQHVLCNHSRMVCCAHTLMGMENLAQLINRVLVERGETVTAFAARIGVNRLTVNTWKTSLPAAATLRRVADDLAIPYSHVLAAALASAGYAASAADLMAGQQVHVITHFGEEGTDDGESAVVFTDPARAAAYAEAMSGPAPFGVEESVVQIDSAEIPETIEVLTTVWSSRTDEIRQTTALSRSVPTRLQGREVTAVEATALAESDLIVSLQVDSLTAEAGHTAIMSTVEKLRQQGRLAAPNVDPYPGLFSRAAYLVAKAQEFGDHFRDQQAKGSAPPSSGAEPFSSPMQTVAPRLALFHDQAAHTEPAGTVWPATRRFLVEVPE